MYVNGPRVLPAEALAARGFAEALAARLGEVLWDEAGRKEVARRARAEWARRFRVERYGEEVAGVIGD